MKKITCFLITIFLLLSAFPPLHAQTTEGKDFWVAFGKISANIMYGPQSAAYFDMRIRIICGSEAASITIYFTNLDKPVHYNMAPYEIYTYYFG